MTIAHDDTGSGPAVVLLHSTVCDRRMWDPQILVLADAGYRVIRGDMRGFGDTPMPTGPYRDADDVLALMDHLEVGTAAVVGASGGGRVALEVAARRPHRVTALALLCTARADHEPSEALRAFGAREDELLEAGDVRGAAQVNVDTWVGPAADEATRRAVYEMQRHAFEVQLAAAGEPPESPAEFTESAITAPTLLVSGAHDLPDFRAIAAGLATEIQSARHVELDWAGHLPSLEDPAALNPILLDFLAAHRPA